MAEVIYKLGYKTTHGKNRETIQRRLDFYEISTNHFIPFEPPRELSFADVFCQDSTVSQNTLIRWYEKDHHKEKCAICGQSLMWNGMPLTLILDHINGDNKDNRLENLRWICPNCNSQLPTFAGRNQDKTKSPKYIICPICNQNLMYKTSKMCNSCRMKYNRSMWPTKEKLEQLIQEMPFTQIGELYNASDNSVRKWCRAYNLPYRKTDTINTYQAV